MSNELKKSTKTICTMQQRLEILKKLEQNISVAQLAEEHKVSTRTIRNIRTKEKEIRQHMEIQSSNPNLRRHRQPMLHQMEERLSTWFLERRAMGDRVSDLLLQEKAKEINEEIGGPSSFNASKGWVWRFKNRQNIRLVKLHGESLDADTEAAKEFSRSFQERLEEEDIDLENIYNMDETGFMWKNLPQKTLIRAEEGRKIFGRKMKKDRVTVGFFANATGGCKLPPLFVHKFERPRALKHCRDRLPVTYKAQKNAWVDGRIFLDWIENDFKSYAKQYQLEQGLCGKIILLVDNCPAHKVPEIMNIEDSSIEVIFLPPNTTSILQPMDQGIIEKFKRCYRHRMLRTILKHPVGVSQFYMDFDIKDCIDLVKESWDCLTRENICKSWRKLLGKNRPGELEAIPANEDNNSIQIAETIQQICQEDISYEQVNECMSTCEESEQQIEDLEIMECEDQDTSRMDTRNEEDAILEMDEDEVDRSFNILKLWSERQPGFVKPHVNVLKEYYELGQ
ncbi:jerky protein homolog-like [Prorops nasuta]|uniref:jerky protein homolog-like n=1 Tax=Prorops nasuta TaxID=863751 RepID=UPI0034CD35A2